jgi:hypothetical protein
MRDRWVAYLLKIQCRACSDQLYPHRENAEAEVDHILRHTDFGPDPSIEQLRDALTWTAGGGKYCQHCAEGINGE